MKVIILAAGRGSRMKDKTESLPKCMLEVCGESILSRCIKVLESCGIEKKDIGIVTGYRHEMIEKDEKMYYFRNNAWAETGIFYSLMCAENWLINNECIICYSDIIFDKNVITRLQKIESDFVLPYYTQFKDLWSVRFEKPLDDLESFSTRLGKLIDIGRKVNDFSEVMGQYMGLMKVAPDISKRIITIMNEKYNEKINKIDMTSMIRLMIENGIVIDTIPCPELWLECDNQNDIELYEKLYTGELNANK